MRALLSTLTIFLLTSATAGATDCPESLQLPLKSRFQIHRLIERPAFEDKSLERIPSYAIRFPDEVAVDEHFIHRVDFNDALVNGRLRPIATLDTLVNGKSNAKRSADYAKRSLEDYNRIVDKIRRKDDVLPSEWSKLAGLELVVEGPICTTRSLLIDEGASEVPPSKTIQKEKAATK